MPIYIYIYIYVYIYTYIYIYIYIYIALYLEVNGPERSSRFYVFHNESIHITVTIEYDLFGSCTQTVKFKVQLFRLVIH